MENFAIEWQVVKIGFVVVTSHKYRTALQICYEPGP